MIDWTTFSHFIEAFGAEEPETIGFVLHLIATEVPPQLQAITTAIQHDDWSHLRDDAHRLRGGCLQFGAVAMAEVCNRIEHNTNPQELPKLVALLNRRYEETLALLQRHYQ